MIKIADNGNTMIRVATGGQGEGGSTLWTVYPENISDPTLQKLSPEQQNLAKDLNITGTRTRDDLSGHGMNRDIAAAIAELRGNLGQEQYQGLGFVADKIDIDPQGEIAKVLETDYGIKPVDEGHVPPEVKG